MKLSSLVSFAFASFALATASASNISVVDFAGTTLNPVVYSNNATIINTTVSSGVQTAGSLIRIGYFNSALQTSTWAQDLRSTEITKVNEAMTSFIPLGESAGGVTGSGSNAATGPRFTQRTINSTVYQGRLAGQITGVTSTTGAANSASSSGVPSGTRLYLIVYSDFNSVLAEGDQIGVFSADTWLMPSDNSLNLSLNTTEVNTAGEVFRGSIGSLVLAAPFAAIPEPAFASLLVFGTLLGFRRRRA
jgi:hypothetical protein